MKKFLIVYVIFSIILLGFIYLITVIQEANTRTLELFYELADEALEKNDLDDFIKYQSVAYQKLDQIETEIYSFHVYQVVAKLNTDYINQFSVYVMPKTDVNRAGSLNDLSDKTGIIIKDDDSQDILYATSTDSSYTDHAVSYGINRIGFYYYHIDIDETYILDIELKDYDANIILQDSVDFEYIHYNPEQLGNLTLGYTTEEQEALLDINTYIQPALIQNITIFLIVDIVSGAILYFFIKNKSL